MTTKSNLIESGLLILLGAIFLGAIFSALFFGLKLAHSSMRWPSTEGNVVDFKISQYGFETQYDGIKQNYKAEVTYKYVVESIPYSAMKVMEGNILLEKEIIKRYSVGKDITVYYDPNNPSESVLVKGIDKELISFLLITIAIGLFVSYMLYFKIQEKVQLAQLADYARKQRVKKQQNPGS